MHVKARIAITMCLTFVVLHWLLIGFEGFNGFGHFANRENWLFLLRVVVLGATNAVVPTGLVMLGVWSNSWFKDGIERRAQRRLQKYSGY